MARHSSILAWEIPWTEEFGGLQSMELQRPLLPLPCSLQNDACNLVDACTFYFCGTVSGCMLVAKAAT